MHVFYVFGEALVYLSGSFTLFPSTYVTNEQLSHKCLKIVILVMAIVVPIRQVKKSECDGVRLD